MATSSIFHSFVISDEKTAERFVDAMEQSFKNPVPIEDVSADWISGPEELSKLMKKRRQRA